MGCVRGIERVGCGKVGCEGEREWGVREGKEEWD